MRLRSPRSRRLGRRATALCAAAWSLAGFVHPLHAEPGATGEYRSASLAAFAAFGYGSSAVGETLLGDLGAELVGIRSFRDRAVLLQWDALFAIRGGILGNEHPYTPLVGPRTIVSVEAGYRWLPERRWSFYTGAGLRGDFSLLAVPGTDIAQLRTVNGLDGVGGRTADGAIRVDAGASLLDVAFFQEALRAPGIYTRGAAFAEGGVAARFDLAYRLTASVEALAGRTGTSADAALGTTDRTTYAGFSGVVRYIFGNEMWIAVAGGYSRELDHVFYTASATAYDTATPPTFEARAFYAVPLGSSKP